MWETIAAKVSMDSLRMEILRIVYGNRETVIARVDPRVLFVWYTFFALYPWFTFNRTVLLGICVMLAVVAALSRVSGLVVVLLGFGILGQVVGWGITALLFGGDLSVFISLSTMWLKLLAISLASVAIFTSMDPDRFSDGLLAMGLPEQSAFSLSYAYRMVPVLVEEYANIFNARRMRGRRPENHGILHTRWLAYYLSLMVRSFYPMILNTAKRMRTTVEGLHIRGFTHALNHPEVKRMRLKHLSFGWIDVVFVSLTLFVFVGILAVGHAYPL